MAAISVTPIAARIHWDDVKQVWKLKASRQTKEGTKFKEWEPLFEFAGDLATILSILLTFWNIIASGVTTALPGDFAALGAQFVSGTYTPTYTPDAPVVSDAVFLGTELLGGEYDGTDIALYGDPTRFWGQTP